MVLSCSRTHGTDSDIGTQLSSERILSSSSGSLLSSQSLSSVKTESSSALNASSSSHVVMTAAPSSSSKSISSQGMASVVPSSSGVEAALPTEPLSDKVKGVILPEFSSEITSSSSISSSTDHISSSIKSNGALTISSSIEWSSPQMLSSNTDTTYLEIKKIFGPASMYLDDPKSPVRYYKDEALIRRILREDSYVLPPGKQVIRLHWTGSDTSYSGGFHMPMLVNDTIQMGVFIHHAFACYSGQMMVGEVIIFEVDDWDYPTRIIKEHTYENEPTENPCGD